VSACQQLASVVKAFTSVPIFDSLFLSVENDVSEGNNLMASPAAELHAATDTVTVLAVGPIADDHTYLKNILECSDPPSSTDYNWRLKTSRTTKAAKQQLRRGGIPIVLCETDLQPDAWKEMLDHFAELPVAPLLIVTSRQADDRLWVEALNLGAYDVLAKPFDRRELVRTLGMAWENWKNRQQPKAAAAGWIV
jgi:CheY-like chemotaxis protein